MTNGYDYLMTDIPVIHEVLDYCESLLAAQKKLIEYRRFNSLKDELLNPVLVQLAETGKLLNFIEHTYNQKTKPGIIEHNQDMIEASKILFDELSKSGVQESEAIQRREKLANNKLDYESIELKLTSLKEMLSSLKQSIESNK